MPVWDAKVADHPSAPVHPLGVVESPTSQRAWASQPGSPIGITEPNSVQTNFSVNRHPTYPPYPSGPANPAQIQQSLVLQDPTCSLMAPSQSSLGSQRLGQHAGQSSRRPQLQNPGMFNQAHDFTVVGTFVENTVTYHDTISNSFMEKFLRETIPGAAFDSSARDPPPRCHPGTRLAVLKRCIDFIGSCKGEKKMRWVVGGAGVGKSAVMQSVTESPDLPVTSRASVFFSVNGRDDSTKAIKTMSYQFAAKSGTYRRLVEDEISRDPSLLQSSMEVQFKKLIIEPFIHNPELNSAGRVLVTLDGLDECNRTHPQRELLRLISNFCIMYPSSPIVWLIASRPEPHITSFFSGANVLAAYEKEEISVDSDGARQDVERLLRFKLTELGGASDLLDRHAQWPEDWALWKIANAAGGLFAYADTAVKYVGDSTLGDPASQLSDILYVIDNHPMDGVPQEEHPMALLDALYARILSNVPSKNMICTRKLLLALITNWGSVLKNDRRHFIVLCNWLSLTPDEAYAAITHLRSVLRVPKRDQAHKKELTPFHKSFIDYLLNFKRSGFSRNIRSEVQQFNTKCNTFRILKEAPDGVDYRRVDYAFHYGSLKSGSGSGDKISLTWPADEGARWSDDKTRLSLYQLAIGEVAAGVERGEPVFQDEFCIRLLTTQFKHYSGFFPHDMLCDLVFDQSRRHDFLTYGILRQIPIKTIGISEIVHYLTVSLQLRRAATSDTGSKFSDPWNSSCDHEREGEWEEGKDQDWTTTFDEVLCSFCFQRFETQLDRWKTQYPDHTVTIMSTSTRKFLAEIKFVDPKDSARSEWTYRAWYLM